MKTAARRADVLVLDEHPSRAKSEPLSSSGVPASRSNDERSAQQISRENARVISFELRNPLTPILGHLDLLRDELGTASPRAAARITAMEAKLQHLLERMVEMAALGTDLSSISTSQHDLGLLVVEAAQSARDFGAWKKVRVEAAVAARPVALIDRTLLESALRHILNNAVTFSRRGGIVVIECGWRGDSALITITDEGPGMTEQDRTRTFELFYRGDDAVSQGLAGFGLGLPRARQIIEAHGGTIALFRGLSRGTIVEVNLPALT